MTIERETITNLLKVREITAQNFPVDHSFIPYDILIIVLDFHFCNKKLSVKNLFVLTKFSDMGLRYHFKRLVDTGWIDLVKSEVDSRIKEVVPSDKLLLNFGVVVEMLKK